MEICSPPIKLLESAAHQRDFGSAARANPLSAYEAELIAFNLQTACQIHQRRQFFNWSQGVLQGLVSHELLICLSTDGDNTFARLEDFSTHPRLDNDLHELQTEEAARLHLLTERWRNNHCEAVLLDIDDEQLADSVLCREMNRLDSNLLLVHGVSAPDGKVAGLYLFICKAENMRLRQAYLAELIIPVLHAALMRTRVETLYMAPSTKNAESPLTRREQEILKWICLGKSNIEIGLILGISRLTVKNHVQEMFRRLNVINRAQAAAKALTLHLIRMN